MGLQAFKRQLARAVIRGANADVEAMDTGQLLGLLEQRTAAGAAGRARGGGADSRARGGLQSVLAEAGELAPLSEYEDLSLDYGDGHEPDGGDDDGDAAAAGCCWEWDEVVACGQQPQRHQQTVLSRTE